MTSFQVMCPSGAYPFTHDDDDSTAAIDEETIAPAQWPQILAARSGYAWWGIKAQKAVPHHDEDNSTVATDKAQWPPTSTELSLIHI